MTLFSRTRASVLATLTLTIADPPPATAVPGRGDLLGTPVQREHMLSSSWAERDGNGRSRHDILDRLEL